jgi:hydrogenase nickel incorporation protein HypA/HybF
VHELSIASSILDTVRSEISREGVRPLQVGLRVGALSGVDPDALAFGFEALVKGSDLDGLALEIERVAHRRRCPACTREFEAGEFDVSCPGCGDLRTELKTGDELEIAYLEVDDR